ncbi:helix-turn-helix domain-containing protein [Ponticoccus litoralis]|uniref:AraC family transcriptional regulator n=1 Tax=Ponticoccus litoralis TaxID=422297 RepID=A0AAW9SEB9_9RHOB
MTPIGAQMQRTLSQDLNLSPELPEHMEELLTGFMRERQADEPGADIAAANYLALLLLQLWRLARRDLVHLGGAPQGLSERFVLMAARRVRDHLSVDAYARDLQVSRNRLGSAVKRATGLSPRAYLHRLLVRDAMELLANTGMPVSQIAFRLGYSDPAYFTRFFRRETGQNPGAFRRSFRRKNSIEPQSFAAWP